MLRRVLLIFRTCSLLGRMVPSYLLSAASQLTEPILELTLWALKHQKTHGSKIPWKKGCHQSKTLVLGILGIINQSFQNVLWWSRGCQEWHLSTRNCSGEVETQLQRTHPGLAQWDSLEFLSDTLHVFSGVFCLFFFFFQCVLLRLWSEFCQFWLYSKTWNRQGFLWVWLFLGFRFGKSDTFQDWFFSCCFWTNLFVLVLRPEKKSVGLENVNRVDACKSGNQPKVFKTYLFLWELWAASYATPW